MYEAEHTLEGGEKLELAGFEIDVIFTPGHSPGHVTFSILDEAAVFSGDVLFQGSVGRTDLPGGDWPTLLESIRKLVDDLPAETAVYPGHMGITRPAPSAPPTRSWLSSQGEPPEGAARHVRRAAAGREPPPGAVEAGGGGARPRRLRVLRVARVRGHELFARGVGESTDIVQKEMFTFEDKGAAR